MRLNAEFDRVVGVRRDENAWRPSPLPGVDRMMLDRIGGEVARATSIVRYAPGSRFSAHVHGGGEEFLVLDGVFSDSGGDFGPGSYVRNPIGTSHAPWSEGGTTIFVKLNQFAADDDAHVVVDTGRGLAKIAPADGVRVLDLHLFGGEQVSMIALDAGARVALGEAPGGAELLVVDGEAACEGRRLSAWDWLRLPDGLRVEVVAVAASRLFVKTGHLTQAALATWLADA